MNALKLKVVFSKTGDMRFISHLDLVRLFQRASRRSGLPVALTQGFNPHYKISIMKALKLGVESSGEVVTFHMSKKVESDLFIRYMNENLPEGVRIIGAEEIT